MRMTISGIILAIILGALLYGPWLLLSPETFAQRALVLVLIDGPILAFAGTIGVLVWLVINGKELGL